MSPRRGQQPPPVEVTYRDLPIARVAAYEAARVAGVVRLQRRPRVRPGPRTAGDLSAVEVARAADGTLEVSIRLVVRLRPGPAETARTATRIVRDRLATLTGSSGPGVRVEITVTDVEP